MLQTVRKNQVFFLVNLYGIAPKIPPEISYEVPKEVFADFHQEIST